MSLHYHPAPLPSHPHQTPRLSSSPLISLPNPFLSLKPYLLRVHFSSKSILIGSMFFHLAIGRFRSRNLLSSTSFPISCVFITQAQEVVRGKLLPPSPPSTYGAWLATSLRSPPPPPIPPTLPAITFTKMLPFPNPQNLMERSLSQGELNPPPPKLDHPNSFFPFSTSKVNSDNLHDILSTQLILPFAASMANAQQPPPSTLSPNVNSVATTTPPMRSSRVARKDRHSKIFTAMGPRDRRMRLSLEVSRKFFNLQDMLGFDKASKTVQWLLTMSKAAIEKLTAASRPGDRTFSDKSPRNESSASECEDVSTVSDHKGKSSQVAVTCGEAKRPRAKRARSQRKAALHPNIARENRARARARARERTREKKWMSSAMLKDGGNQWASSSLPFDTIEKESGRHDLKSSLDLVAEVEERCSSMPNQHDSHFNERAHEVPLEGGSVPISILDHAHNIVSINDTISVFQEQWDMERILLADIQLPSRPWEAFNNSSIA